MNKEIKRRILKKNKENGKIGEQLSKRKWEIQHMGFSPTRSPKGQDFIAEAIDVRTFKPLKVHIESKVNSSKLSPLQKKTKIEVIKSGNVYQTDRWKLKK
jgi:hypothetical protein